MMIVLLLAVISMAAEMLYLFPEYATRQFEVTKLLEIAFAYNNNLLVMIPAAIFYFVVLNISQNKKFLFEIRRPSQNKYKVNSTGDCIQAMDPSASFLRQRETILEQEKEAKRAQEEHDENIRHEDAWHEANSRAAEDEYWHGRAGY